LVPVFESEFEAIFKLNSYCFLFCWSLVDVIKSIHLCCLNVGKFVLDADIEKCFDHYNHEKLLYFVGPERKTLR